MAMYDVLKHMDCFKAIISQLIQAADKIIVCYSIDLDTAHGSIMTVDFLQPNHQDVNRQRTKVRVLFNSKSEPDSVCIVNMTQRSFSSSIHCTHTDAVVRTILDLVS